MDFKKYVLKPLEENRHHVRNLLWKGPVLPPCPRRRDNVDVVKEGDHHWKANNNSCNFSVSLKLCEKLETKTNLSCNQRNCRMAREKRQKMPSLKRKQSNQNCLVGAQIRTPTLKSAPTCGVGGSKPWGTGQPWLSPVLLHPKREEWFWQSWVLATETIQPTRPEILSGTSVCRPQYYS